MKTLKILGLSAVMFIAGVVATLLFERFFVVPDLAMDISKLAYEGAVRSYNVGYIDGENNNSDMYEMYFEEDVNEIIEWEYKFIK